MPPRRLISVQCLIFCAITLLFIYFFSINIYFKNRHDKLSSENIENYMYGKDPVEFIYYKTDKAFMTYEEYIPVSSEIDPEPQSYGVINEIQYADYDLEESPTGFNMTYTPSEFISLKQLLSICIDAAKAGGMQLKSVRRNFDLKKLWRMEQSDELDNSVSIGKKRSHTAMEYILKKSFPNIKLVSETYNGFRIEPYSKKFRILNSSDDVLVPVKNVLIWLDPLEPEHEYNSNLLEYVTTMICVSLAGKPIIGVIHQPFENFTKWVWDGKGVSNSSFQTASEPNDVSRPQTIVVDTSQRNDVKMDARIIFKYHMDIIPVDGAGYKALQLTEDRADAYVHMASIKKWKTCAGNALLNALNGKMTSLSGADIYYGDPSDVTVKRGLIATMSEHNHFMQLARKIKIPL